MAESAAHVALAALTALSWLGLGAVLLAPLPRSGDRALDALNRLGAGAVGFSLLTAAAAWLHVLHRAPYLAALGVTTVIGAVEVRRLGRGAAWPSPRGWPRWQQALAALVLLYVVMDVLVTAAPISSPDALFYHASAPAIFQRDHGWQELPWSWPSYQPFGVEMLTLDGFLLRDFTQGAFAPLLLALAAVAAVAGATARAVSREAALLAAAIFFAQPFMVWTATSTFVEPGLAFVVALAAWNLWAFASGRAGREAVMLAGVFAGAGAGMKYVGVAAGGALALAFLALAPRRVRAGVVVAFIVPAVLVALPWYVKNALETGDPFYPLLAGSPNSAAEEARRQVLEGYGQGRSLLDALLLPFRLLTDGEAFDRGDLVSPLFLALAPAALLDYRLRRAAAVALAVSGVYAAAWFATSQQARFLVPLMPAFAALAAVGALALAARGRLGRVVVVASITCTLTVGLGLSAVYASQFARVVAGRESTDAFLERKTSFYSAISWLDKNLPPDARVLLDAPTVLYLQREFVVWTLDALPESAGPEETRAFAQRNRFTHVMVAAGNAARLRQLGYLDARPIATVRAATVLSRTRSELGPPVDFRVFALRRS